MLISITDRLYFVYRIVEYIVHDGMKKDLPVFRDSPLTDHGSVVDIYRSKCMDGNPEGYRKHK